MKILLHVYMYFMINMMLIKIRVDFVCLRLCCASCTAKSYGGVGTLSYPSNLTNAHLESFQGKV